PVMHDDQHGTATVLLAAVLSAGVTAPVFEEFIFRVLFQGWLERTEDEALGALGKMRFAGDEKRKEPPEPEPADSPLLEEALPDPNNPYSSPLSEPVKKLRKRQGPPPTPPAETAPGLPHGWAPVLISSFVFALVHISQGAAFISLFPLALVLGHLYQRTHRILPSVAAHMTFNLCSLALAWAQALVG
ncbi:MAG: CPBP family intramembrane metalloprotease, partial [Planctomycetales bacterium]|nr:CPBP family intramembrane metalloprotease [Planctomycetales bacterium]